MNSPTTVDMSHPSRWLAVLRILVGLYFVKALWTKLDLVFLGGFFPWLGVEPRWIEAMPQIVTRQAAENPILWYKAFLEHTVLPNSVMFAKMIAWAETLVGTRTHVRTVRRARCTRRILAQPELRLGVAAHGARVLRLSLHAAERDPGAVPGAFGTGLGIGRMAGVEVAGGVVYLEAFCVRGAGTDRR